MCKGCTDDHCVKCRGLKLEVGKKYKDGSGFTWHVTAGATAYSKQAGVFICETVGDVRFFNESGLMFRGYPAPVQLVREYIEPVVHKRDVVWYKHISGGIRCDIAEPGKSAFGYSGNDSYTELKRETVTYTEKA